MLMGLMFLSTLDIHIRSVLRDIHKPTKTLMTLGITHILAPTLVLPFRDMFSTEIYVGLIIATVINAGISCVFLSKLFGGEESRALVVVTISGLLAPFTVPFLLYIYAGTSVDIEIFAMMMTIFKLLVVPFIAAQLVVHYGYKHYFQKYSTKGSLFLLFLLIVAIVSPLRSTIIANLGLSLVLAGIIGTIITITFLAGFSIGSKMTSKISYGVSASFKNVALATVIAIEFFGAGAALPAIIYTVVNPLLLIPMQWFIEGQTLKRTRAAVRSKVSHKKS